MAKKATEHEKILRIHEVYKLLIKGASRYRVVQYVTKKWEVCDKTADTYLAEARKLLARDLEIERPKWLEQAIAEMQDWKWQELNPDDRDENVTTTNRLAALQFLKAQASLLQFEIK
jgi:phage/plasmid-associated DNA primase